ncbi:hypothetical protein Tco_0000890 [Tanacetum coccineum]
MSDSEDSTVTYTAAPPSPDYVPGLEEPEQAPPLLEFVPEPVYPEFMPPEDDDIEEDDDEDPEEDPTDYPTDRDNDDNEEEPSGDKADDEEEDPKIMNPQEKQQVAARDDKWVPFSKRVKISSTNIRLETTMPKKEETFQVVIDLIKISTCFKAFTNSADVPEIFMQQFWNPIKKTILEICLRVEGVDFTDVPDDDIAHTFLIDLGYKGEDYQEYGLPIPETMLTNAIKQLESYQMFIKYSTCQIHLEKSRGKGSQGKKVADESQEIVDVCKEAEPKPEPARKKTYSKRRVKKKVTLSADDNIISDDPNAALELVKSISQTKAEEAEAARKVHATHARIVTESAKKKSGGRSSKSVVIQDTPKEQKVTNIMQALNESKKTIKRQHGTGGSNEGTCSKLGVPDESTVVSATSSEGTSIKPEVPNEEKDITEEKDDKDGDADDEGDYHISDTQDVDDKDVKTESDEDDIYKYKIRVRKDEDEEMINAEVDDSDKGDEEITDAAKTDAEKTSEVMDAPTIPVSTEENLGDPIDIRVDIIYPEPVAAVAFPAMAVVRTQAQHGEAIRGILEHSQEVPIEEEMSTLRFRMGMAKAENPSLCGKIKTMEAIETITHSQEKRTRIKIERQLASVQESQRHDQENFRKLQELLTSQLGRHP